MERIFEQMTSWIKGWIVDALMVLLEGMFDNKPGEFYAGRIQPDEECFK